MDVELEKIYKKRVKPKHLSSFGQFFTPRLIARFMCRWVAQGNIQKIYDPAFGLGSFYFASQALSESIKFSGMEVDKVIYDFINTNISANGDMLKVEHSSYFDNWGMKHKAIVCNPPYMRFQNFKDRDKVALNFKKHLGAQLVGYTNTASAFLFKSLSELKNGGRLAYIMPLEFLNTGYGSIIKSYLIKLNQLKALIRIIPEKDIFPNVTTSIGIILVHKNNKNDGVKFCSISRISELGKVLSQKKTYNVSVSKLDPNEKWLKYFKGKAAPKFKEKNLLPLSSYGSFKRGIATGANSFFSLSLSQSKKLKIPLSVLKYCITKSSQISSSILNNRVISHLEKKDSKVFILDANGRLNNKEIRKYINCGEERKIHLRYLTKNRTPWYKLEKRTPAPILFGVFSRNKFKIIRNYSSALNLTCYHGFYPNIFGEKYVDMLFLFFQSKTAVHILKENSRVYGDNLIKFEPGDLNKSLTPSFEWFDSHKDSFWKNEMKFYKSNNILSKKAEYLFRSLLDGKKSV